MRSKSTWRLVEAEGMENDLGTLGVSGDPLLRRHFLCKNWSEVQHMQLVSDMETTWREVSHKVARNFSRNASA